MADLITLEQAKLHLRIDTDAEDNDLNLKIAAASQAIAQYLKWTVQPTPVPELVSQACLMLVGYMYRERDGSNESAVPSQYGYGYLPLGVTAILYSFRKPSLA